MMNGLNYCRKCLLFSCTIVLAFAHHTLCAKTGTLLQRPRLAVVTYLADSDQERKASALIKSIRRWAVSAADCRIYIVLANPSQTTGRSLQGEGVSLLTIQQDSAAAGYPLAMKAYAAAQVEALLPRTIHTLIWFDPETLALGPLDDLILDDSHAVAIRPVFLANRIGQPPAEEPNDYWRPIYQAAGVQGLIPTVKTVVDEQAIKAYFNCEVFSVHPHLGICRDWARVMTQLLTNESYQRTACTGFLPKLFLHQAVLSAVITARIKVEKIHWLPLTCGYPLNIHSRMPDEKKPNRLNSLSCLITEDVWNSDPGWMDKIPSEEPLTSWLRQTYADFLKRSDGS